MICLRKHGRYEVLQAQQFGDFGIARGHQFEQGLLGGELGHDELLKSSVTITQMNAK